MERWVKREFPSRAYGLLVTVDARGEGTGQRSLRSHDMVGGAAGAWLRPYLKQLTIPILQGILMGVVLE